MQSVAGYEMVCIDLPASAPRNSFGRYSYGVAVYSLGARIVYIDQYGLSSALVRDAERAGCVQVERACQSQVLFPLKLPDGISGLKTHHPVYRAIIKTTVPEHPLRLSYRFDRCVYGLSLNARRR
jgi:hypothetical protein